MSTPLDGMVFQEFYRDQQDTHFKEYIVEDIQLGFRIGINYHQHSCRNATGCISITRQRKKVRQGSVFGMIPNLTSEGNGG